MSPAVSPFPSVRFGRNARVFLCLTLFCAASHPLAAGGPASEELPVIEAMALPVPGAPEPVTPLDGSTLYRNEATTTFNISANPPSVLQVITMKALPTALTSIEFRFTVITATNLRVEVRLWDDFDPNASPVNTTFLGGANYDFGTLAAGNYTSSTLALPPGIAPADKTILVQFDYRNATTGNLTTATVAFAGNGVAVGSANGIYYEDADDNDQFDFDESFGFGGGPPNLANFYLHLRGVFPPAVDPGYDLLTTPPGSTYVDFSGMPIPDHFFDLESHPFSGIVSLVGQPLDTSPPGRIFPADTIVRRLDPVPLPDPNTSGTTRVQVTQMRLVSTSPITVTYTDRAPEQWNVDVWVSPTPAPTGTMTITRGPCAGGTFTSTLNVQPLYIFRRVGDGLTRSLDTGDLGWPAIQLNTANGHWLDFDPNLSLVVLSETVQVLKPTPGAGIFIQAPTSLFFPGVRIARCGPGCAGPGFPRKRLTTRQGLLAAHDVLPAQALPPDLDGDGYGNDADNCSQIPNQLQEDGDDDTVGDACDNCSMVCNVDQADDDMNGRGNVCEVPEVSVLSLSGGRRATLSWGQVGPPEVYDVLKSDSKNLSVGTECLKQNYPVNTLDDTALPGPGQVRYYLPRVVNATGSGPWGYSSAGAEILSSVCSGGGTSCRDALNYQTATVPAPGPGTTVTFCAPIADCVPGGSALSRSRASDKLCQNVYGATCAGNDDCAGANGCCADKVTGDDLTLGACAPVTPDNCAGSDVRCACPYTVPAEPTPPAIGFRCDCVCQTGACPPP